MSLIARFLGFGQCGIVGKCQHEGFESALESWFQVHSCQPLTLNRSRLRNSTAKALSTSDSVALVAVPRGDRHGAADDNGDGDDDKRYDDHDDDDDDDDHDVDIDNDDAVAVAVAVADAAGCVLAGLLLLLLLLCLLERPALDR